MSKHMCPSCGLSYLNDMKDLVSSERKHWAKEEEELEKEIAAEETKLEQDFKEFGYQTE